MKHVVYKVHNVEAWRKHCAYLNEHQNEALASMELENCVYERCVLFERNEETYLVGSAKFLGTPVPADQTLEVNKRHKAAKCFLSPAVAVFKGEFILPKEYEVLYEFEL